MELAVVIVVITVVAWILGFLKSARTVADMANAAVTNQADKLTRDMIRDRVSSTPLSEEEVKAAVEDIKKMEEIRSLFR